MMICNRNLERFKTKDCFQARTLIRALPLQKLTQIFLLQAFRRANVPLPAKCNFVKKKKSEFGQRTDFPKWLLTFAPVHPTHKHNQICC